MTSAQVVTIASLVWAGAWLTQVALVLWQIRHPVDGRAVKALHATPASIKAEFETVDEMGRWPDYWRPRSDS